MAQTLGTLVGRRRLLASAAGIAAAVALAGPALPSALAAGTASVDITAPTAGRFAFAPAALTVPAGTTITWTNRTDAPHTVTADGGAFGSGVFSRGQSFRLVLTTPGTYTYYCAIHPYMHGSITVTPVAAEQAVTTAAAPTPVPEPAAHPYPPTTAATGAAAPMPMPMPQPAAASYAPTTAATPAVVSMPMPQPAAPAPLPARMPDTGAGGTALPLRGPGGLALPTLAAIPVLVAALRLRRRKVG